MDKERIKPNYRRTVLRRADLDHSQSAVLNSLAISEFGRQQLVNR